MSDERAGYAICPQCDVHCWLDVKSGKEPNLVKTINHRKTETDYGFGEDWTEIWKCPACGHEFEETNGYP